MPKKLPDFSYEQWQFLAVLNALGGGVSIDILGFLVPLPPGPLFEVIKQSKKTGWLISKHEGLFSLSGKLPENVLNNISSINTPIHLNMLANKLRNFKPLSPSISKWILRLIKKSGIPIETIELEMDLAEQLLKSNLDEQAWNHLKHAADLMITSSQDDEISQFYISTVLTLSCISFNLGKGLVEMDEYLVKAQEIALKIGDMRSLALINMHLGWLYYFSDRREKAIMALSMGLSEIEDFTDEDILNQSSVFQGLFYYMQGLFKEALPHLERAAKLYESQQNKQQAYPIATFFLGFCLTYLGEFHRAIGSLDFYWRMAADRSNHSLATTLRVILGTVLLLINRKNEALMHIEEARQEAEKTENAFALFISSGPIALNLRNSGQMEKAYDFMMKNTEKGAKAGLVRQFSSPWYLEMDFEFEQAGFKAFPDFSFKRIVKRVFKENNVHLMGVAMRLQAFEMIKENKNQDEIIQNLEQSEAYLKQSGDIVQISKTLSEKARFELSMGNIDQAREISKKAWAALGGYADDFFPDDLRSMVTPKLDSQELNKTSRESLEKYIELADSMFPVNSHNEMLQRSIIAFNRFFGAERGGFFWFPDGKPTRTPELRASCNLSENDIIADIFKPSHELILNTFKEGRPIFKRNELNPTDKAGKPIRAMLCLPIKVGNKIRAVLYHDNSYLEDCFDFLDTGSLQKMMNHISRQIARMWEYFRLKEERNELISEKNLHDQVTDKSEIVYQSIVMDDLISQVDKAAGSVSTVLILGESGVGKELIARRIHNKSPRHDKAFVIVDANTLPEGLFESELFGHEKGAFTGADSQKKGRMEIADKGTLFIDEIGELPKSIQVKLLRAIQEKTFTRVGSTITRHSDFRLVAATNRDLAHEVNTGNFREDLFYRLNVVPFLIPALRQRIEDIPLLANYFLSKYGKKYHRENLYIDSESQALLQGYKWPGNIRELENIIERAVLLSSGNLLEIDLPLHKHKKNPHSFEDLPTLDDLQRRYIQYVMSQTDGKISGPNSASEILGVKRTTLQARMKKLGL